MRPKAPISPLTLCLSALLFSGCSCSDGAAREQAAAVKDVEGWFDKALKGEVVDASEDVVFARLDLLERSGLLKPVLKEIALRGAATAGVDIPEEQLEPTVNELHEKVAAGLMLKRDDYQPWPELNAALLAKTEGLAGGFGPDFIAAFERLTGARLRAGSRAETLVDGPAAFARREERIAEARERIDIHVWSIYSDDTGQAFSRRLIERARAGVKVRVMVDGLTASKPGHGSKPFAGEKEGGGILEALAATDNIEVLRWRNPARPYEGSHRKLMVVDGRFAIVGGINIGDWYSHFRYSEKRDASEFWRDTDIELSGPAAAEAQRVFNEIWDRQLERDGKKPLGHKISAPPAIEGATARAGVVDHVPGPQGDAHVLLATLLAIRSAKRSIKIENAYFVPLRGPLIPAIKEALDRGVEVTILTNGVGSIDEPIITVPILRSLVEVAGLKGKGGQKVRIYLRKGTTLHSKFLVVDEAFSMVGSYNYHPRSYRYEGEAVAVVLDAAYGKELAAIFDKDCEPGAADEVGGEAIERRLAQKLNQSMISNRLVAYFVERYFFDQL